VGVSGVLAALLSLLPVGGAAFVWIPAVIWLFFDKALGPPVFFILIWGLLLGGARQRASTHFSSQAGPEFLPWRCLSAFWAVFRPLAPLA